MIIARDRPNGDYLEITVEERDGSGTLSAGFSVTGCLWKKRGHVSGRASKRRGREADFAGCIPEGILATAASLAVNTNGRVLMPDETEKTVDERLSEELGVDVPAMEAQLRFRLDLARMQRGEAGRIAYVFIERQHHPDAVVVFDTPEKADAAFVNHPIIDALCEEDCLDAYVGTSVSLSDNAAHEVILPESWIWLTRGQAR